MSFQHFNDSLLKKGNVIVYHVWSQRKFMNTLWKVLVLKIWALRSDTIPIHRNVRSWTMWVMDVFIITWRWQSEKKYSYFKSEYILIKNFVYEEGNFGICAIVKCHFPWKIKFFIRIFIEYMKINLFFNAFFQCDNYIRFFNRKNDEEIILNFP